MRGGGEEGPIAPNDRKSAPADPTSQKELGDAGRKPGSLSDRTRGKKKKLASRNMREERNSIALPFVTKLPWMTCITGVGNKGKGQRS